MIDVINAAFAVTDFDQYVQDSKDVFAIQYTWAFNCGSAHATIEFHPPHTGQVVALFGKEQVPEQVLCRVLGWRLAGTHHAVNIDQRFQFIGCWIDLQRVGNVGTVIQIINMQNVQALDTCVAQLLQQFFCQFSIGVSQHLARLLVNDGICDNFTDQVFIGYIKSFYTRILDHLDVTGRDPLAGGDQHFSSLAADVKKGGLTSQTPGN